MKLSIQNKIKYQKYLIVALSIVLAVLTMVSFTAAWYIRTKTDSATIRLADPVNISITNCGEIITSGGLLANSNTVAYPGDTIQLQLGMILGTIASPISSPAYIRARLTIDLSEELQAQLTGDASRYVTYLDAPLSTWSQAQFSLDDGSTEVWFVYSERDASGKLKEKELTQSEGGIQFIDGSIQLSNKMTNVFANTSIDIAFEVQAIQTANVTIFNEDGSAVWPE